MSTMIMVDSKQIQLMNLFQLSGFNFISGDTHPKKRAEYYDLFRKKEILILMSTVSKEGINIPSLDCVIRAGANKSWRRIKQEKGRGLRVDYQTGKDKLLMIDFFDNDKYWNDWDPIEKTFKRRVGYLKKQSKLRLETYKETKNAEVRIFQSLEELYGVINGIW
jgi:superfamily II DNA or RNA helicase